MNLRLLGFCSLLVIIHRTNASKLYYWRDYNGEIPRDAVPGGLDKNDHVTYIGQVFIQGKGLFPGRICPGKAKVDASYGGGVHTSDIHVQILCSEHPECFEWLPVTSKDLHTVTIGKRLILGGSENDKALNIGRIFYQSQIVIGKVTAYNLGDAKMHFPYNGKEETALTYQVLGYNANLAHHH